ncbi:MAG: hypothetical protein H6Q48_1316 [Deltaproteobacteria bacterium]|nr:hypothetical protein [Deltaproteobacteria bacterium]
MDGTLRDGICSPARRISIQIVVCGVSATSLNPVFLGMALSFDLNTELQSLLLMEFFIA